MTYELIVTQLAKEDLINYYDWYESKKVGLGEDFLYEIEVLFDFIRLNPLLFPIKHVKIYHESVVRCFPFVIIYRVEESKIIVLSVFKTPQDPDKKP